MRTNGERIRELVEAAGEIWTAGRDASLKRTEQIADERGDKERAHSMHRRRRDLGAVDADELAIHGYDALRADVAIARISRLTSVDDVRAVLAYESANKARKGVLEAAGSRIGDLRARPSPPSPDPPAASAPGADADPRPGLPGAPAVPAARRGRQAPLTH